MLSVSATTSEFEVPLAPMTPLSSPLEGPGAASIVHEAVVAVLVVGAPHVNPVPGVTDWMKGIPGVPPPVSVAVSTEVNDWL